MAIPQPREPAPLPLTRAQRGAVASRLETAARTRPVATHRDAVIAASCAAVAHLLLDGDGRATYDL